MAWDDEYTWATGDEAPTASQAKKAGDRIRQAVRRGRPPPPDALALLDLFRAWHGQIHRRLQLRIAEALTSHQAARLEEQQITIAGRPLKTREAIIAKLVRERSRLNRMQDITGARVVVADIATQQTVLELLLEEFADCEAVVAKDTRTGGDELGYRGLHVVVLMDGRYAEIQVRTNLQGLWAQVVEKLDESRGTDLKHGNGPDEALQWLRGFGDRLERADRGETGDLMALGEMLLAMALIQWEDRST